MLAPRDKNNTMARNFSNLLPQNNKQKQCQTLQPMQRIWSVSQDSYEYPGEIVILKGFEEATTDKDNNEEGNEFKSKEVIEVHNS